MKVTYMLLDYAMASAFLSTLDSLVIFGSEDSSYNISKSQKVLAHNIAYIEKPFLSI